MKKSFKALLSLALSAVMVASSLPMAMAAGTDIVKDHMDWSKYTDASYLEGISYYTGKLVANNTWGGYTYRNGGDAKHWIGDSSLGDTTAIVSKINSARNDESTTIAAPTRGGAFGYVGHNYGKLRPTSANLTNDKWMGVKDISAYKDNGYLVFKVVQQAKNTDNAYFCITAVSDQYGMYPFESKGTTLPITKETHGNYTEWKDHRISAINGVKISDYYKGGAQMVAIPLKKLIDDPDFQEFGGSYYSEYVSNLQTLYADEDYKMDLRLYSGAGVAKRDTSNGELLEIRFTAADGFKIVALQTPENLVASVNNNQIALSWNATGDEGVTYRIARTSFGNTEYIAEGLTSTSYTDVVTKNGTYTYTVEAYSGTYGVPSPASNVAEAVVNADKISAAASSLLIEDWKVPGVRQSNTTEKAEPRPFFMGDFYISSSSGLSTYRFSWSNVYVDGTESQRWYINDSGFDPSNKGREITYRPTKANEYFIEKNGVQHDAYIPHYVGNVTKGNYAEAGRVPEEWIHDKWAFNGFRYAENILTDNMRDISEFAETGSILYNISVPAGMNTDGLYLAITYTTSSWNKNNTTDPTGQIAIGVPLTDYYDTTVGGWQTIKVPMSAYNLKDMDNVFAAAYHINDGIWFNAYGDNWRKWGQTEWKYFTGIGIVREDVDDTKCEEFYLDVKNLAVVNEVVGAPAVSATFDADAKAINLSWEESGYTDTVYTITKSNGTTTESIDVVNATSYVDAIEENGEYTYTVETKVGKYGLGDESAAVKVTVDSIVKEEPPVTPDEPEEDSDYTVIENMDWQNWSNPATYTNHLADRTIYVSREGGEASYTAENFYNDYEPWWSVDSGDPNVLAIEINDTGYSSDCDGDIATLTNVKNLNGNKEMMTIPTSDGVLWGYKGSKYFLGEYNQIPSNWRKDRWFGIKDISAYEDNGFLVFDVEVDANADVANAYFAMEVATKEGEVANKGITLPVTDDQIASNTNKWETKTTFVIGVPLAKYYDTSVMGRQKVYVPISEFVDAPAMREMYSKSTSRSITDFANNLANCPTDLRLFHGMGIAKKNSANYAANPLSFNAKVYSMTIEVPNVKEPKVTITPVDMGSFAGKAWDVVVDAFDGAKSYIASFVDGADSMTGEIGFDNVEADGGSVAFAIFLHTSRANVALDIAVQ